MNSELGYRSDKERSWTVTKVRLSAVLIVLLASTVLWLVIGNEIPDSSKRNQIATLIKDEDDRELFLRIAEQDSNIANALLSKLFSENASYTIVWRTSLKTNSGEEVELVVLDRFVRPVAGHPLPLLAVLSSRSGEIQFWSEVCDYALGFVNATKEDGGNNDLTSSDHFSITVRLNWTRGFARYRYSVVGDRFEQVGETENREVDDKTWSSTEREMLSPIPIVLTNG